MTPHRQIGIWTAPMSTIAIFIIVLCITINNHTSWAFLLVWRIPKPFLNLYPRGSTSHQDKILSPSSSRSNISSYSSQERRHHRKMELSSILNQSESSISTQILSSSVRRISPSNANVHSSFYHTNGYNSRRTQTLLRVKVQEEEEQSIVQSSKDTTTNKSSAKETKSSKSTKSIIKAKKATKSKSNSETAQEEKDLTTYSSKFLNDNGLELTTDDDGAVTARPAKSSSSPRISSDFDAIDDVVDNDDIAVKIKSSVSNPSASISTTTTTPNNSPSSKNKINSTTAKPSSKMDSSTKTSNKSSTDSKEKVARSFVGYDSENNVQEKFPTDHYLSFLNDYHPNDASSSESSTLSTASTMEDNKSSKSSGKKNGKKRRKQKVDKDTMDKISKDKVVDVVVETTKPPKQSQSKATNKATKPKSKSNRKDQDKSKAVIMTPTSRLKKKTTRKRRAPTKRSSSSSATPTSPVVKIMKEDVPKPISVLEFNVVLTHCTADFDSLASAVGLAKLWAFPHPNEETTNKNNEQSPSAFESKSSTKLMPTYVVLPRGAHPAVQRFLALHKHLFPIRSLRSLPTDLSGLNRLGLVDAQRRDRIGPAENLLSYADRVTIVDHHIDGESDIPEATDYVVEKVGSVSAMVAERLQHAGFELSEAEATLLALGIHADTGSLCYDSTTTRDAMALAWVMGQGASQAAIAEHAHASLSQEQQGVLTNALINTNSTVVHGVTVSTVLLSAEGFINGLAAVTQDALELSSSDVFLLAVVYDAKSGGKGKKGKKSKAINNKHSLRLRSKLLAAKQKNTDNQEKMEAEAWKFGENALKRRKLQAAFDIYDADDSGFLDQHEIATALARSGIIASQDALASLMTEIDTDGDGLIDFEEFVSFSEKAEKMQTEQEAETGKKATTMIIIGRVKAGVNMKAVNLNHLFQQFGGGGHAKAASCTVRLEDESEAGRILDGLVDEMIETSLMKQPTVGDFMTSPVLSAKPSMTEKQVEDLFTRYDVRALPVVDDNNDLIGLVTYKEVAAAKQRLWNKEQKRLRQEAKAASMGKNLTNTNESSRKRQKRKLGSALKGWMKQHVQSVEASRTMAEVEAVLLETDVGCIPVTQDGTKQLVGMVTRTDLLRQHKYYPSLHYHNKGFSDSIAARKPIIELRKKLKKFDLEE